MLSSCYASMDKEIFLSVPDSTNAVESHNRFGKSNYRVPIKIAMMTTYKEDMAKTLEIIASNRNVPTSYYKSASKSKSKSLKRRKTRNNDDSDDAEGPPDKKSNFIQGLE